MKILLFSICGMLALPLSSVYAAPVNNPEQKARMNVYISDEMKELNAPYEAALKKLSPEQIKILEEYDQKFTAVLNADAEIIFMASKLEACRNIQETPEEYNEKFIRFRDHKNSIQDPQIKALMDDMIYNTKFIDEQVVRNHTKYSAMMAMQLIGGIAKLHPEVKTPTSETCKKARDEVDAYIAKYNLPPSSAADANKQEEMVKKIMEETARLEGEYQALLTTLSQDQLAQLQKVDAQHDKTLLPDTEIMTDGMRVKACHNQGFISKDFDPVFVRYRDKKNAYQEQLWKEFFAGPIKDTSFVDQKIMKGHLTFRTQKNLERVVSQIGTPLKGNPPSQEDCALYQKEIEAYLN